jgi:hypothetical protein
MATSGVPHPAPDYPAGQALPADQIVVDDQPAAISQ